jgi:broad specificity phosphatase PhoE
MNDFINGIHYGGPGFTDIFPDTPEYKSKYHDSPLGPTGLQQADALSERLGALIGGKEGAEEALSLGKSHTNFLDDLDLVVVSPLTRALQTMEIGLYPHIKSRNIPIVAVPQARERLYMVSDIGKPRSELERAYEYVDFESGFDPSMTKDAPWHWIPTEEEAINYNEWRPYGEGQNYAHLGEIEERFDTRMNELHRWLHSREEKMIAVVCHYGVIDWMLQEGFENCELRVVPFEQLKPRALTAVNEFETQPVYDNRHQCPRL